MCHFLSKVLHKIPNYSNTWREKTHSWWLYWFLHC